MAEPKKPIWVLREIATGDEVRALRDLRSSPDKDAPVRIHAGETATVLYRTGAGDCLVVVRLANGEEGWWAADLYEHAGLKDGIDAAIRTAFHAWVRQDTGDAVKLSVTKTQTDAAVSKLVAAVRPVLNGEQTHG